MKKIIKQLEIKVRGASNRDFFEIKEIAKSSFIGFRNWQSLPSTEHYRLNYPMKTRYGLMNVSVLENKHGNIASYIYYQYRPNDEVYLMEIAAKTPKIRDRVPLAGTILLGYALDAAIKRGCKQGTLNVVDDKRNVLQGKKGCSCAKLIHFYNKFGYKEQKEDPGYTSNGGRRYLEDVWMVAFDLKDSLLKINKHLEMYV